MKIFKKIIIIVIITSFILPGNVFAYDREFFSANDILFYDPDSTDICSDYGLVGSYTDNSIANQEKVYEFLTTTAFTRNNNQPLNTIQASAILGNLLTESSEIDPTVGVEKNASHKGIAQWSSPGRWDNIVEPKTDLINQLNYIKTELDGNTFGKNVENFWDITESTELDEATFLIARNYEVAISNGGGSTSWSNDEDAEFYLQGWAKRKNNAHNMLLKFGDGLGISCGGMTDEEANNYMETYENSDGRDLIGAYKGCGGYDSSDPDYVSKNILANCVAVVKYFLQNHTTYGSTIGLPNGGQVVDTLIKHGWIDGGNTPKPYSVFSTLRYSNDAGHTGLVLNVTDEYMVVFEEGCGKKLHKDGESWPGINRYPLSEAQKLYTFAYPPEGTLVNL